MGCGTVDGVKRVGIVLLLVVAASCGGDSASGFDEDALREHLADRYPDGDAVIVDDVVDQARAACNRDDMAFELAVATAVDNGDGELVDVWRAACPDRVAAVRP